MNFKFLVLIFCLFPCLLSSQIKNSSNSLEKMSYNQLYDAYINEKKFERKNIILNIYRKKAFMENNKLEIATCFFVFTNLFIENYKKASIYNDSLISYSKDLENKELLILGYINKGIYLNNDKKVKESVTNYFKVYELSRKYKFINYEIEALNKIGILKSEYLQEFNEALEIYKKCNNLYLDLLKDKNFRYKRHYLINLFCIADVYKSLNLLEKSTEFNILGYKESIKFKDTLILPLFTLNEGSTLVQKKEYQKAIDSINKALPKILDVGNQMAGNFYLGKAYQGLKNKDKALLYFKKVDSIDLIHKVVTPEFIEGYHFLIKYYKEKNQPYKQLYYSNRVISLDSIFQINYKSIIKKIQKEYEMPLVISEKEELIEDLKGKSKLKYVVIFVLILIIIGITFYLSYKNKRAIKRFNQIILELEQAKMETPKVEKVNKLVINDTRVQELDKKITQFEKNKMFLDKDLSINKLAEEFDSNQKYLSEYINQNKNLTFGNYLNQLRITYIVQQLYDDKKLRKYSIESLAEEAGFNKQQTFSTAFKAHTGMNPSNFIKELNKNISNTISNT
jgi:AraC-like DNA-binding protein